MGDLNQERADEFLQELSELTRKHGIVIYGCGCCGSPTLEAFSTVSPRTGAYNIREKDGEFAYLEWGKEK